MTNQDIINKTESLVHLRFTEEELNEKLSQMFGCNAIVSEYEREECVKKDLPDLDNQLIVAIENELVSFDLDLYYIKDNGDKFYITEVCFNYA
jgi:hypothetical protein